MRQLQLQLLSATQVLVVSGSSSWLPQGFTEGDDLINLKENSGQKEQCSLPESPGIYGAVGFTLGQDPVVCGGYGSTGFGTDIFDECRILEQNKKWTKWNNCRSYATG